MTIPRSPKWSPLNALPLAPCGPALARQLPPTRFKAVAYDYCVTFDANSVVPAVEKSFPGKGAELTRAWRAEQFEYRFLRAVTPTSSV